MYTKPCAKTVVVIQFGFHPNSIPICLQLKTRNNDSTLIEATSSVFSFTTNTSADQTTNLLQHFLHFFQEKQKQKTTSTFEPPFANNTGPTHTRQLLLVNVCRPSSNWGMPNAINAMDANPISSLH
jgi:hypothetical protein